MAKKNGHVTEELLEKILDALGRQTEETRKTNERIDALAASTTAGFVRLETRLDEIAKNTGTRHRELEARVAKIEEKLGLD